MTKIYDDGLSGILGTASTAELQIGSNSTTAGSALVAPADARAILEVIPYQAGNAVVTASESLNTQFRFESPDASTMIPKKFQCYDVLGGLGATTGHLIPALQSFTFNTPLKGSERINAFAQPITATTTATNVGYGIVYSTNGTRGSEQFWDTSGNTTITAPAAYASNAGASTTITGTAINYIQPHVGSVVQTAAQAWLGMASYASTNFVNGSYPYKFPIQPYGGFLGTTFSPHDANGDKYVIDEGGIALKPGQTIVTSSLKLNVVQTGNANFNTTFGFVR